MKHHFRPDPNVPADPHRGTRWCLCGRAEANQAHHLDPDGPPAMVDVAAVRTRETDMEDDADGRPAG